jgi:hypothetical protein
VETEPTLEDVPVLPLVVPVLPLVVPVLPLVVPVLPAVELPDVLVVAVELPPEPLPELEEVVVTAVVLAVALRAARAGSCPVTSTTAIRSQAATNRASAPEITRRRIIRARARRAWRIVEAVSVFMIEVVLSRRSLGMYRVARTRISRVRDA